MAHVPSVLVIDFPAFQMSQQTRADAQAFLAPSRGTER